MEKIKVAFLVDVLREHFDGVSNTMHQIIKRIPKEEVDAIFITPQLPDEDIGFPVYQCTYLGVPFNKGYRLAVPGLMPKLKNILDEFAPDVIHWSSPFLLGSYAIKYAKRNGLPNSTIYHTHYPSYADYYLKSLANNDKLISFLLGGLFKFYKKSDVIFAPTRGMRDYLVIHGISENHLKIWGRGVDRNRFNPEYRNDGLFDEGAKPGSKKILFVSRLVKEKETDTLIRLHDLIKQRKVNWQLIITGDGPDRERMIRKMPKAIFTGKKEAEELSEVYASCDIFIFPSLTETFGNVVLEAMSSGLPVVAANAGGPADIVQDGQSGFLIDPKDENAFFDRIQQLVEDEVLYTNLRNGAIEYATQQSWKMLCEELFRTYHYLAQK